MINYTAKEYDVYLESDEWKRIRNRVFKERGQKCEICGVKERLQIHHCDYSADPKYAVLCKDCHSVVSQMVIDYNEADWKDKIDYKWLKEFIANRMLQIYKTIYCPQIQKNVNFLNYNNLHRIQQICKDTLSGQCKSNYRDSDINYIIRKKISTVSCHLAIQSKITQYRKEFTEREIKDCIPLYAINHHLGIDVKYLKRGGD